MIRFALTDWANERERAAAERERQRRAEERAQLEVAIKGEKSKVHALGRSSGEVDSARH